MGQLARHVCQEGKGSRARSCVAAVIRVASLQITTLTGTIGDTFIYFLCRRLIRWPTGGRAEPKSAGHPGRDSRIQVSLLNLSSLIHHTITTTFQRMSYRKEKSGCCDRGESSPPTISLVPPPSSAFPLPLFSFCFLPFPESGKSFWRLVQCVGG